MELGARRSAQHYNPGVESESCVLERADILMAIEVTKPDLGLDTDNLLATTGVGIGTNLRRPSFGRHLQWHRRAAGPQLHSLRAFLGPGHLHHPPPARGQTGHLVWARKRRARSKFVSALCSEPSASLQLALKATGTIVGAARAQRPPAAKVHQVMPPCAGQLGPGQRPDRGPRSRSQREMAHTLSTAYNGHTCASSPSDNTVRGSGGRRDATLAGPLVWYSQGAIQMHEIAVTGPPRPTWPHPGCQDSRDMYRGPCSTVVPQRGAARISPKLRPVVSPHCATWGGGLLLNGRRLRA